MAVGDVLTVACRGVTPDTTQAAQSAIAESSSCALDRSSSTFALFWEPLGPAAMAVGDALTVACRGVTPDTTQAAQSAITAPSVPYPRRRRKRRREQSAAL